MQFRELSESELEGGYRLLSALRFELSEEQFGTFIASQFPRDYRPIGAYERGELRVYAGVSIRENLELGRHLIIDDFIAQNGFSHHAREMIDFLADYAKMHKCNFVFIWGRQEGLSIEDLEGFRPKRDGYIKAMRE